MTTMLEELDKVMQLDGPDGRFDAACIAAIRFLRTHHATLADMAKRLEAAERYAAEGQALLPGVYYMDPPDGGDVSVIEQLRRMAKDAARYRWLRTLQGEVLTKKWNGESWCDASYTELDAAIDAATQEGEG